jgi:acetyl-CoA C-acetyltransferase
MNDGAAAVVMMRASRASRCGLRPLVTLESFATAALAPALMGYAPVLAVKKLFERTGLDASDIDVFEINEAFAAQVIPVIRDLGLDQARINPYGGAIALGHPMGATVQFWRCG